MGFGDTASQHSAGSGNRNPRSSYRRVANGSSVDDTLFGKKKEATIAPKQEKVTLTLANILPGVRATVETRVAPGAISNAQRTARLGATASKDESHVVLSTSDLSRMKTGADILTPEQQAAIRKAQLEEAEHARAISDAREREKVAAIAAKLREEGAEDAAIREARDQAVRDRARWLQEEQLDEVKRMNQMALYSKCVTIRDAQIEERRHVLEEQLEEDRRMYLVMEAERIKALQAQEAIEAAKKEEQRRGALVLQQQIDERAAERLRQLELREHERAQILSEIERVKRQEAEQLAAKRAAGRRLLEEVARTNAAQIERKKLILQAELEEDARIAAYVRARELKEQEQAEELARIAHEKEMETARLRAQQERASDIKAELDELRAQRAAEARERDARARERKEQERVRAMNADLAAARERQKEVKTKLLADQARQQQEEFFRIIDAQIAQQETEHAAQRAGAELRRRHKDEVLRQIAENEERRKLERREFLEEGERMRAAHAAELSRLAQIKERKLRELQEVGVPGKYRAELVRTKIGP